MIARKNFFLDIPPPPSCIVMIPDSLTGVGGMPCRVAPSQGVFHDFMETHGSISPCPLSLKKISVVKIGKKTGGQLNLQNIEKN